MKYLPSSQTQNAFLIITRTKTANRATFTRAIEKLKRQSTPQESVWLDGAALGFTFGHSFPTNR